MKTSAGLEIEVIGHGGAGDFFPGNSLDAIKQAFKIGVDRIEVDLLISSDNELVLVHDEEFIIDGRKRKYSEIRTSDFRSILPGLLTIDEMIEINADRVPLLLDVKLPGYEQQVIEAIKRHRLESSVAISSTHPQVLKRIKRAIPTARFGLSTGHIATGIAHRSFRFLMAKAVQVGTPIPLLVAMKACGATETMIQHRACTKLLVEEVHRSGRRVYAWTVDRPDQMQRVLKCGVDGIISNRPDLATEAVTQFA
jgi:glycerophosphoryl diester phosphodiesterase